MNNNFDELTLLEKLFDYIIPKYREAHDIMVSMIDFETDAEIRVADLGCGFGHLSTRILEAFPKSQVFGLDKNSDIIARVKENFEEQTDRILFYPRDLNDTAWSDQLTPLHAIVSSFTLDYLPIERHKAILKEAYDTIEDNGRWVSCEFFKAEDPRINRVFHDIEIRFIQSAIQNGDVTKEQIDLLSQSTVLRQEHCVCGIDEKVEWLKQAGFSKVEIPWRFLNLGIISAEK